MSNCRKKNYIFELIVPSVKKLLGISDLALWRKRWNKRIGKLIYHKKYSASDLISLMQTMGMKNGSVVCIHASMMQFYNYTGTAIELVEGILSVIGKEGTLMMPAFPANKCKEKDNYIFNPSDDKTGAGYLAETFRTYPGVIRSNNVRHSVCAIGKYAQYLTQDHTKGHDCWDKYSPWYRLCELDGLVFNLGMPRSYIGTFHHCVESILQYEHPYWTQFFNKHRLYMYKENGVIHEYSETCSELLRKTRESKVTKFFTDSDWSIKKISNLEIKVFYAKNALEKMISLGRKGISVYYLPSTNQYEWI